MRFFLLEDDYSLGVGLRSFLVHSGHQVDWANCLDAVSGHAWSDCDAMLVDWQLPDGSGVDWLAHQRAQGCRIPAIVLTARDRLSDKVLGLNAGADDYLVKPFDPEELLARLRAVLRRTALPGGAFLTLGPFEIDHSARRLCVAGQAVELTAKEWTVLEALCKPVGQVVTREQLEAALGHSDDDRLGKSNAVEVHISNMRRKLGRRLIDTVRGAGYRIRT